MVYTNDKMHYIQKHILKTLMYTKWARFKDMRPAKVDSNAYSYHLRALQKEGLVDKGEPGYRLSPAGLSYVDKISIEKFEPRIQPKLTHMMIIENSSAEILLLRKSKQPFIETWMLPYGKIHLEDTSFYDAAVREADEKLNFVPNNLTHIGTAYIRASIKGELVSSIVANIFKGQADDAVVINDDAAWYPIDQLLDLRLAPAVLEVLEMRNTKDLFFKQCDVDW